MKANRNMYVYNVHHSKFYNLDSILTVIASEFFEAAKGKIKTITDWQRREYAQGIHSMGRAVLSEFQNYLSNYYIK